MGVCCIFFPNNESTGMSQVNISWFIIFSQSLSYSLWSSIQSHDSARLFSSANVMTSLTLIYSLQDEIRKYQGNIKSFGLTQKYDLYFVVYINLWLMLMTFEPKLCIWKWASTFCSKGIIHGQQFPSSLSSLCFDKYGIYPLISLVNDLHAH